MKRVFTIGSASDGMETLLMEIGRDHCCYAFLDRTAKAISQVSYILLDEFVAEEKIAIILEELKDRRIENLVVCAAYAQAFLIPQDQFNGNYSLLDIYDMPAQHYLNDPIPEWQMVNIYSVPDAIHREITARFSSPRFFHSYTPALKIYNGFTANDQIDLHFSTQHFRVLVKKDQIVVLAQTYSYKTPLDVVYYLLKICYEFGLDQSAVFLIVSGLVEYESAMYNELHNYYLNLNFAQVPSWSLPHNDLPHYYFNSIYNLASCVS